MAEGTELTAGYMIIAPAGKDITGYKVKVLDPDTGKEVKAGYTGSPITFDPSQTRAKLFLVKGKDRIDLSDAETAAHFTVQYVNNLNKRYRLYHSHGSEW
jgi:hypothetical protein